ncbi:MAG: S1C family serine protease [Firmicutes bacterium]|nr:S1C family serine protease [Bacillota bacterium]
MKKNSLIRILLGVILSVILSAALFAGCAGKSAYEIWLEQGNSGTISQWLDSHKGQSAYQLWLEQGNTGDEVAFLASLRVDDLSIEDLFSFYLTLYPDLSLDEAVGTFMSLLLKYQRDPIQDVVQSALRNSVSVRAEFSIGRNEATGAGAGVIYSINRTTGTVIIITNYHVIHDRRNTATDSGVSANIRIAPYGREYFDDEDGGLDLSIPAMFIGGSISRDIALLQTSADIFKHSFYTAAEFADSNNLIVGQSVIAVGNPEGVGVSATSGIVNVDSEDIYMESLSSANQRERHRVLRVDAAINRGNSGGAVFDTSGKVVGIVNAKAVDNAIDNIGYAIPANVADGIAQSVLDGVRRGNRFIKHIIGIQTNIIGSRGELVNGIVRIIEETAVLSVSPDTPAFKATPALQEGDVLVSAKLPNREAIQITRNFMLSDYLYYARNNQVLVVRVLREGTPVDISITINSNNYNWL